MPAATDIQQANLIIMQTYPALREALADDADKATLDGIVCNPIAPEKLSSLLEFGYAKRDQLTPELAEAVADAGHCAVYYGFYGLAVDGRGAAIETILRGGKLPKGVEAPAVDSRFSPPVPPQMPVLPPAAPAESAS